LQIPAVAANFRGFDGFDVKHRPLAGYGCHCDCLLPFASATDILEQLSFYVEGRYGFDIKSTAFCMNTSHSPGKSRCSSSFWLNHCSL